MRSMKMSKETKKLFKVRRRFSWTPILIAVLLLLLLGSYIVYDNSRIQLESIKFSMPTLPKAMEGYTILHISDIHEKDLGENGEDLGRVLGGAKPSIVLISGGLSGFDGSADGFLQILAYFKASSTPVYYVLGDGDMPYTDYLDDGSYGISPLYLKATELGGIYLQTPIRLYEGDTGLWLLPASTLMLNAGSSLDSLDALESTYLNDAKAVEATQRNLEALLENIRLKREVAQAFDEILSERTPNDLNLYLTHVPALPEDMQPESSTQIFADADLILSGHNHGAQFRLPFIGAIRVQNSQFPRDGWLPNNAYIRGLTNASGQWQHISPGLGTGQKFPLNYRVFSTPTVTLIQLTRHVVE